MRDEHDLQCYLLKLIQINKSIFIRVEHSKRFLEILKTNYRLMVRVRNKADTHLTDPARCFSFSSSAKIRESQSFLSKVTVSKVKVFQNLLIVPSPLRSTSITSSKTSSSVGFWPIDLMTPSNSLVDIEPLPSFKYLISIYLLLNTKPSVHLVKLIKGLPQLGVEELFHRLCRHDVPRLSDHVVSLSLCIPAPSLPPPWLTDQTNWKKLSPVSAGLTGGSTTDCVNLKQNSNFSHFWQKLTELFSTLCPALHKSKRKAFLLLYSAYLSH